jgi:hypothetical protein
MQRFLINTEVRLASINSQIDSLQSRLSGSKIEGRTQSIGPVETSMLEIELAELRMEHANIIAKLPM